MQLYVWYLFMFYYKYFSSTMKLPSNTPIQKCDVTIHTMSTLLALNAEQNVTSPSPTALSSSQKDIWPMMYKNPQSEGSGVSRRYPGCTLQTIIGPRSYWMYPVGSENLQRAGRSMRCPNLNLLGSLQFKFSTSFFCLGKYHLTGVGNRT